jgi:2-polyprenyl-3-methyl-5-hydroxy-6-metoxy-1,4-benzoquinol methylase
VKFEQSREEILYEKSISVKEQYNSLGKFYNALYGENNFIEHDNNFLDLYSNYFNILQPNAKILDCACVNGVQASALKRMGYNITATDISEEMISLTREYMKSRNITFPTKVLSWEDLPSNFSGEFDLVFCIGNSISHCINK